MKPPMKQSILTILTTLILLMSFAACNGGGQSETGSSARNSAGDAEFFDTNMPDLQASMAEQEARQQPHGDEPSTSQPDAEPVPEEAEPSGVNAQVEEVEKLRIRLTFDNSTVFVQLYDIPASRELLSRLPLTLPFEDYMGTEKISYLSEPLTVGVSSGTQPAGDFSYYAPWGNLAIFYNDLAPAANGLVVMGSIESGKEYLASMEENFTVTIELDR